MSVSSGYRYYIYKTHDASGKKIKPPILVKEIRGKVAAYQEVPYDLIWQVGFNWATPEGTFELLNRCRQRVPYSSEQREALLGDENV